MKKGGSISSAKNEKDIVGLVGLALSGGGSRAIAFHLGCLRALNRSGLLDKVETISAVSGGSIIGAMYACSDQTFGDFEDDVRAMLRRGFVGPSLKTAVTSLEGVRAVVCFCMLVSTSIFVGIINKLVRFVPTLFGKKGDVIWQIPVLSNPVHRFASRTTILAKTFDRDVFHGKSLSSVCRDKPNLIINAAELRTGTAFYFGSEESGSWKWGKLVEPDQSLAIAVAASASYPLFLPALDRTMDFVDRDGKKNRHRVILTDGGVYDNLGLAPLWPDRDPSISLNAKKFETIICCRAGYGSRLNEVAQFAASRLKQAFFTVHDRAQNASIKRLFDMKHSKMLRHILIPYLGQKDTTLQFPPVDLVKNTDVLDYPTDFSAMDDVWIDRLSKRGEQLTHALIEEHMPWLSP